MKSPSLEGPAGAKLATDARLFQAEYSAGVNQSWRSPSSRTKDGSKIERMLFAGCNLDKAREVFVAVIKRRPTAPLFARRHPLTFTPC
jgi:hypothetical protein